jgi:hypothetical protein
MAWDTDLETLFPHWVTVEPYAAQDAYGEATYGDPAPYRARVEQTTRRVLTRDGQERVSGTVTYLVADRPIDPRSKLTLPDGTTPVILSVESAVDEDGTYYVAVRT